MKRLTVWIGLAIGLAALPAAAQTTPTASVSPLRPVITSYPTSPFSVSAGVATLTLGQATNELRIPNGTNAEYGGCAWASNVFQCGTTVNSGTGRALRLTGASGGGGVFLNFGGTDYWAVGSTNGTNGLFGVVSAGAPVAPSAPTDATVVSMGHLNRLLSSTTITPATGNAANCGTAFAAAALTADCTIATLPAGMKLVEVYADVTVGFTCSGTCTGTKVFQCGTAAGGTQVFAAGLNVAATGQFGLSDADLGSGMTRAAAIQGGLLNSWSATTPISCRFTSGTGNWGTGAATNVNAGSIKFFLVTEQIK